MDINLTCRGVVHTHIHTRKGSYCVLMQFNGSHSAGFGGAGLGHYYAVHTTFQR